MSESVQHSNSNSVDEIPQEGTLPIYIVDDEPTDVVPPTEGAEPIVKGTHTGNHHQPGVIPTTPPTHVGPAPSDSHGHLPVNAMAENPLKSLPDTGEKQSLIPAAATLLVGLALMKKKKEKQQKESK
ncbi:LPXTG cell wall anchor domain-containing protein [Macrococcus capreoli]